MELAVAARAIIITQTTEKNACKRHVLTLITLMNMDTAKHANPTLTEMKMIRPYAPKWNVKNFTT